MKSSHERERDQKVGMEKGEEEWSCRGKGANVGWLKGSKFEILGISISMRRLGWMGGEDEEGVEWSGVPH